MAYIICPVAKKVHTMYATDIVIEEEVFRFSGQTQIDTWSLRDQPVAGMSGYSKWLVADLHLTMQRIRELADDFPFWQHRRSTGRPPVLERDLLIAFLLRQLFDVTVPSVAGATGDVP